MNNTIIQICEALDKLSESILNTTSSDVTLTESYGWSSPPLNRHDLASLPSNLSEKLRLANIEEISEELTPKLEDIPDRINTYTANSLSQLLNSNSINGAPVFLGLMEWIKSTTDPLFSWEVLGDNKAMPSQLARRLRSLQIEINNLVPDKELIQSQIKLINEATDAAESLPTDLETLKQARAQISQFSSNSSELYGKIDTYFKEIEIKSKSIQAKHDEAEKIVQQCNEAYRITTSVGLAAAFDSRASRLSTSMWVCVVGLALSLGTGAWIGAHRVAILADLIKAPNPQWGGIWIHLMLSILSISAPVWFAWLATKQINQRFRLSEDYAFKASVAKAYEGYRREAAKIDPEFESRLFASALTRLEEAPLRLVESDPHGSPWHELLESTSFQKALINIPGLKDQFLNVINKSTKTIKTTLDRTSPIKGEEEA